MSGAAEVNGAAPAAPAAGAEKRKRFNLKNRLAELGFDPEKVDGLLSPIEAAALPTLIRSMDDALESVQAARKQHEEARKAVEPLFAKLQAAKKAPSA